MATERFNVLIGLQVDPRDAISNSERAVQQILASFRKLEQGINTGIKSSSAFQGLATTATGGSVYGGRVAQQAVLGTTLDGPGSALFEARGKLTRALIHEAQVKEKANARGPGSGTPEASIARTDALIAAGVRTSAAQRAVADQYEQIAKQIAQEFGRCRKEVDAEMLARGQSILAFNKQRDAVERAAEIARQAARGDASLANFRPSYQNPDLATSRGQQELGVNLAQRGVIAAQERLATVTNSGTRNAGSLQAAQKALETAILHLVKQEQNLASMDEKEMAARAASINSIINNTNRANKAQRGLEEAEARAIQALNKRAQVDAEAGRADASVAGFKPSYPGADLGTRTGRLEGGVNEAERREVIARERLATELNKETRTVASLNTAALAHERAERQLAAAQERLAIQTGHIGTSFAEQFRTGFSGQSHRPYAEQIGQAFKFSVFYGAAYRLLDGITQTFAQTLQEGIQFQQAVSELVIATGRTEDEISGLADQLGQRASAAGFAPSAGVLVGARSIGLYGATEAQGGTAAQQATIADISARVVSRLAFSSGQQPADLQTNIAAIVNAFGGGPEGQFRVADLDAYMSHFFGVAPGSTIQAVSEAGTVGRAAGFDQEQVNAIAADLMARTGQTAPAVAGFMAQIFSRGGEGSLTSVAQRYGIDPTLELSKQIEQLAEVYKSASPQERSTISAAFGRGKVQNAAIALLQDYGNVQDAAAQARGGAAEGAADKQFQLRLGNIGGQIQVTVGVLREFANQLGQSGALQVLGAFILVGRETVEALTGMLRIWNSLPGVIKSTAAALLILAASARSSTLLGALTGRTIATGVGGRTIASAGARGAPIPLMSGAGAAAVGAGVFSTLVNPVTIAIGGLVAIGALKNKADELGQTFETTSKTLDEGLGAGASVDDLRAHAAALDAAATDTREASNGVLARVVNLGADRERNLAAAEAAEAEADRLRKLADSVQGSTGTPATPLITGFDTTSLQQSMEQINQHGGTAATRLDALSAAIRGAGDAANIAREAYNPSLLAGDYAQGVYSAIQNPVASNASFGAGMFGLGGVGVFQEDPGFFKGLLEGGLGKNVGGSDVKNILPELVQQKLSQGDVQKRLQEALGSLTSLDDIDPAMAQRIAKTVLGDTAQAIGKDQELPVDQIALLQASMQNSVALYLTGQVEGVKAVIDGTLRFNPDQLTAILDQALADVQEAVGNLPQTDYRGRVSAYRSVLAEARQAVAKTVGEPQDRAVEDMAALRKLLANAQFDELEALRRAAQHNAKSKAETARQGQRFLRREINAAVKGNDQDLLARIIGQAGNGSIEIARTAIQEAIDTARAAFRVQKQVEQAAAALAGSALSFFGAEGLVPKGGKFVNPYKDLLDSLKTITPGGKENDVYTYGDGGGGTGAGAGTGETGADRRVAAAQARAIRSESPIAQAKADVYAARVAMDQAKKGTVEYYNALGQYYAARNSLTDAILDYKRNKYLLGIDITDPVAQAAVELRVARDKLRSDAGKGADVRAADQVAVRQAQADLEAQKFQQRLQSVQTAEDLGRISHRKYIQYLDHEKDRLEAIKNRTFQQQQQLDQIDGLLQEAAASMDAQFNLGDIKLPTVYQVRRTIAETAGGSLNDRSGGTYQAPAVTTDNSVTHITVNGADADWVLEMVERANAKPGRTVTASPRRRI